MRHPEPGFTFLSCGIQKNRILNTRNTIRAVICGNSDGKKGTCGVPETEARSEDVIKKLFTHTKWIKNAVHIFLYVRKPGRGTKGSIQMVRKK